VVCKNHGPLKFIANNYFFFGLCRYFRGMIVFRIAFAISFSWFLAIHSHGQSLINWVDPFVGTDAHGHTYPGATVPFGMVQVGPDTRLDGWDGCSGYHWSDDMVYGFSHTHLQGTGVSDYGDVLFMPTNHSLKRASLWRDVYKSAFDHSRETAEPGYYSVYLNDYGIMAELTATERCGIHRYTFQEGDSCRLFIDMMHRDELLYYDIGTIGDTVVYGYRVSKAWAPEQHSYFYAVFSRPFRELTQLDIQYNETDGEGKVRTIIEQQQIFSLDFPAGDPLVIRVGWSGTDVEGAQNNLNAETHHFNFDIYRQRAAESWEAQMAKWSCPKNDDIDRTTYYTSLYHCCTTPNIWSDVDGRFRGMDQQIHQAEGYTRYTVFSLWDTFRGLHPLLAQMEPVRTADFINSMLAMWDETGQLPVWELAANETYCMIGYHAVSVIADAYQRGIRNFDHHKALQAMVATARGPQEEKIAYALRGYVPGDTYSESVSKTLEYAYNDWCIAGFAAAIGDTSVAKEFGARSHHWKNLYDPSTEFFRPRINGAFMEAFDPYQVDFHYTEANAWQYRFFVPHQWEELEKRLGGKKKFQKELERMFTVKSETTGREQADITGLIGQYAHGNEPSHHVTALMRAAGQEKAARELEKRIMQELYDATPDGLCGNEDCGQMSAWYVLQAHNEYPLCPGIPYRDETPFLTIPIIEGPATSFRDQATVVIRSMEENTLLHYRLLFEDGEELDFTSLTDAVVVLDKTAEVTAWCVALAGGDESKRETARFLKRNRPHTVHSITPWSPQYPAGGKDALVDGLKGGVDFKTGQWQGWQGTTMTCVVDLADTANVVSVGVRCLQDIKSWIWFPSMIRVGISMNGTDFSQVAQWPVTSDVRKEGSHLESFSQPILGKARFVRIEAMPAFDAIPNWHLGAGGKPWIFADEIMIATE
jgi:predicted alpha-1,2-mannosidase